MAKRLGTCSECPEPLKHITQKTCSGSCRSKRARRLKRQKKASLAAMQDANMLPEHQKAMSTAVAREVKDAMHDVAKEELRPVVREAITEDVLKAIDKLVGLTPRMVELIALDLESTDDAIRQKAYTLLARYTLGNASVAPAPAELAPAPMQVIFHLPRPGDDSDVVTIPAGHVTSVDHQEELKICSECQQQAEAFEGSSDRCTTCHASLMERVAHLRGDAPLP